MARPIRSYPEHQRMDVIMRRLKANTKGIGYWSARDALRRIAGPAMYTRIMATLKVTD